MVFSLLVKSLGKKKRVAFFSAVLMVSKKCSNSLFLQKYHGKYWDILLDFFMQHKLWNSGKCLRRNNCHYFWHFYNRYLAIILVIFVNKIYRKATLMKKVCLLLPKTNFPLIKYTLRYTVCIQLIKYIYNPAYLYDFFWDNRLLLC